MEYLYDPKYICENGRKGKGEESCNQCCGEQNSDDCRVNQLSDRERDNLEIGYYYHGEMYNDHKEKE